MCAAALATALLPDAVVFGCWNDRFGGCGSVLDAVGERHGGCGLEEGEEEEKKNNSPPPFALRGGVRAADAVALLKLFYETGNPTGECVWRDVGREREGERLLFFAYLSSLPHTAPNPRRPVMPLPDPPLLVQQP